MVQITPWQIESEINNWANQIVSHAYDKHLDEYHASLKDFFGPAKDIAIGNGPRDFKQRIIDVLKDPETMGFFVPKDRAYFYNERANMLVILNPYDQSKSSCWRPTPQDAREKDIRFDPEYGTFQFMQYKAKTEENYKLPSGSIEITRGGYATTLHPDSVPARRALNALADATVPLPKLSRIFRKFAKNEDKDFSVPKVGLALQMP